MDALLDGGLPVGAISEVTGPESSGRTSLALAFLAQRTREGQVCAWVDVTDAFDPESAAASGVALRQLLWVRCQEQESASECQTVDTARPGIARDGPAAAGRRLCGHRAGPGRHAGRTREPNSIGDLVSLPAGCGSHAMQPGGSGQSSLCAIERGSGVGVRAVRAVDRGRNRTARLHV